MVKLYCPRVEAELAVIRSILEEGGVPHYVHNGHFGSLKVGPTIELYNAKTIMVPAAFKKLCSRIFWRRFGQGS